MKYIIGIYLTIISLSLLSCSGVVQPVNKASSPLQPPVNVVIEVTATPDKPVTLTAEKMVVHSETKGQTVSVRVSPATPTPPPLIWIDDSVVIVDTAWSDVVELHVGQQLAVMPQLYIGYEWKLRYNMTILELVEDVKQSDVPEAEWVWTAKKVGQTTIRFDSGPPPCREQPQPCSLSAGISETIDVKVNP